jgi:hypothetical protein
MKAVKEIAVKLENKPGTLSQVSDLLGANGVTILGLTMRTQGKAGTLCFVCTDPARVMNILKSAGYAPKEHDVLAVEVPHHPGGLNAILKPLSLAGSNIEYLYTCMGCRGSGDSSIVLLAVDDMKTAQEALARDWIKLYGEELYTF